MGSSVTRNKQNNIAKIGTNGTKGVLNGRFKSGFCFLRMIMDTETIMNAARVPIFTNWANSVMGRKAAIIEATIPTITIPFTGVRKSL